MDNAQLANAIDYHDQLSLSQLGKMSVNGIVKCTDQLIAQLSVSSQSDSMRLFEQLLQLMVRLDETVPRESQQSKLAKIFGNSQNQKHLFKHYQQIGSELDAVFITATAYQNEMKHAQRRLASIERENTHYYDELIQAIQTSEVVLARVREHILPMYQQHVVAGDDCAQFEIIAVNQAIELLEQRMSDLEAVTFVALQNGQHIRGLQTTNEVLIAKINEAFIVTIPLFTKGIVRAITDERHTLAGTGLEDVNQRLTLLQKDAQQTLMVMKQATQDIQQMEKQNSQRCQGERERLAQLKAETQVMIHA